MKTLLALSLIFASTPAFALEPLCVTKQKNAASYTVAQEIGVPVQGVEVVSFENGMWTEATMNNSGTDFVTVRVGNRLNRGMTVRKYEVNVKQIGSSDDCTIKSVTISRD